MTRVKVTELLTETLIADRLSDRKYYAREVTLDYGTSHPKRVDVMQFSPAGVTYPSDIEKGTFTCYEVKSCIEDVYSGHGLNFFGEKNYIVTTAETWKRLQEDMRSDKLADFLKSAHPESSMYFGVMALVPSSVGLSDTQGPRKRPMNELLFAMLRAKHSDTNMSMR